MSANTKMDISLQGIGAFLKSWELAVPRYQRSYAWGTEQVGDFLSDLEGAIKKGEDEYFLGSLVTIARDQRIVEVVDGQQRLTTTTILIGHIRDLLRNSGDDDIANEIQNEFLFHRDRRTRELTPHLRLNEFDNQFFSKLILEAEELPHIGTPRPSHQLIKGAKSAVEQHFEELLKKTSDRKKLLLDWIDFLEHNAKIISVMVADDTNAFLIFETLNDRGLALAVTDLIKNYLFSVSRDRIDEVQSRWSSGVDHLESLAIDDVVINYLRHYWSSIHGATRENELMARIKANIKTPSQAIEFAEDFARNAHLYGSLVSPDTSSWGRFPHGTLEQVEILNSLRMVQVRPLLLAVLSKFNTDEVARVMKMAVSWSVRFQVVGGAGAGTLESRYADRAKKVTAGEIQNARQLSESMKEVVPTTVEFQKRFEQVTVSTQRVARYYLKALESVAQGTAKPSHVINPDTAAVNLEHILPRNRSEGWMHFDSDEHAAYVNRLGNQALLESSQNFKGQNKPYQEKRDILREAPFILTSYVADGDDWTIERIERRQQRLAKLAVVAWPLD